ncbi:MAG: hypothetical protein MJ033_05360 [Victivallaceae bacterium]|nr:hypothetical protein [Victivallaceae bacterium]
MKMEKAERQTPLRRAEMRQTASAVRKSEALQFAGTLPNRKPERPLTCRIFIPHEINIILNFCKSNAALGKK